MYFLLFPFYVTIDYRKKHLQFTFYGECHWLTLPWKQIDMMKGLLNMNRVHATWCLSLSLSKKQKGHYDLKKKKKDDSRG